MIPAPSARFPSTAWTCVRAAQDPDHPQFVAAWARLVTAYWRPVFHYLRARGFPAAEAEDLAQEFFVSLREGKALLRQADPGRGPFRQYLRVVLKGFAYRRTVGARRQERFERGLVSVHDLIRDADRAWEPPAGATPEDVFDRQWRADLLAAVRRNLQAYYDGLGSPEERRKYAIFAARHFGPARTEEQPTEAELADRFGLTRDAVHQVLRTVQRRYERLLRQELRDQAGAEADIDAELAGVLGASGH